MLKTNEVPAALSPASNPHKALPNSRKGLRSPELLGRRPGIALAMILFGSVLFGVMVISLQTQGPLMQTDIQFSNSVHLFALQSPSLLKDTMIFGYYVGEHVIIAIGAVLLVYFLYKRFWQEFSMVLIAWLGEGTLWLVTTAYFQRARPAFGEVVWHQLTSWGFPSGHSISAIMCYGLVAYLLMPKINSQLGKLAVVVIAVVIVVYIGVSRVFVGDHYPVDVLAGYGLGFMWSGLVYGSIEGISLQRRKRKQNQGTVGHN